MIELLPFFGLPLAEETKADIREYANLNLYTETYAYCSLDKVVEFFEEPLSCIDRDFALFSLSKAGFTVDSIELIDSKTTKVTLSHPSKSTSEIVSSKNTGETILLSLKIPNLHNDSKSLRIKIKNKLESIHGLLSSKSNSFQVEENLDLHITFTPEYSTFTYIKRDAYQHL